MDTGDAIEDVIDWRSAWRMVNGHWTMRDADREMTLWDNSGESLTEKLSAMDTVARGRRGRTAPGSP